MNEKVIVPTMFEDVKKAIAAYKAEALLIDQEEMQLQEELESITSEVAENTVAAEGASIGDRIQYRIGTERLAARGHIIRKILDELQEEKRNLKLRYVPIYKEALNTAGAVNRQFSGNDIVDKYLYAMFEELTAVSRQMGEQYAEVGADLNHIFRDENVMAENRGIQYHYQSENFKPEFWHNNSTVLSKNEVSYALSGHMPDSIAYKNPNKEAVSND